jgi:uroporphyrinogen-III synthase
LIVLTRDPDGNRRWAKQLERAGMGVYQAPMIRTETLELNDKMRHVLERLAGHDWLVLTSARAVQALQSLLQEAAIKPIRMPPLAVVGERTATAAGAAQWEVKFKPPKATALALAATVEPVEQKRILIARSTIAKPSLAATLRSRGAVVTDLPVYATLPASSPNLELEQLILNERVSTIVFASPSAVAGFTNTLTPVLLPLALKLIVIAIGPTTARAARAAGFRIVHSPQTPSITALVALLHPLY